MPNFLIQKVLFILLLTPLVACQEKPEVIAQIRALKTITIDQQASGKQRRFSGIIRATNSSSLSFEVGGKVQKVTVDIGDVVKKGQVLATLDKEPYKLDVQAAEADLATARSEYKNTSQQFERVDQMQKKGWASKSDWDTALATRDTTKNRISYAQSKLKLAKRDLRLTVLMAPFDGHIASRTVDPYVKVLPGQKLFAINEAGSMDVEFDIPETIISQVHLGMSIIITLPTLESDVISKGTVSFIGAEAGQANAFPTKALILDPPNYIKPGMSADVDLLLGDEVDKGGYLIPFSAILAGDKANFGYVFIFDPKSSTVKKTGIGVPKGMSITNEIEISKGLKSGDIVAIAGISYLSDGQQVKLMSE